MNTFIIAGPSGIGKSHLMNELVQKDFHILKAYTDRARRPTETEVKDRAYLSKQEFDAALSEFIYWFEFQGNRYGYKNSEIQEFSKKGKQILFNLPSSEILATLQKLSQAIVILLQIDKNNFELLRERMILRDIHKEDSTEEKQIKLAKIDARLDFALKEMEAFEELASVLEKNPQNKIFTIKNDKTLYDEVIPYILNL